MPLVNVVQAKAVVGTRFQTEWVSDLRPAGYNRPPNDLVWPIA